MNQYHSDLENEAMTNCSNVPRQNWFKRNWKWLVPTLIIVPLLSCCGITTVFVLIYKDDFMGMVESYMEPIQLAEQNEKVASTLGLPLIPGEPIQEGQSADGSEVTMVFPVTGNKDSGTIRATFFIDDPLNPTLTSAILTVDKTGETIDLLSSTDDISIPETTE